MIAIHCTYCWRTHWHDSLEAWIAWNQTGCGKDPARYFLDAADYRAYVREYMSNGHIHRGTVIQEWLFEVDDATR